ncbi:MAG: hypothetical protein R8K46_08495 [Mariprofundaceae bacterium]
MMATHIRIAWGLAALVISACSQPAPDCADEQVVDTVIRIAWQQIENRDAQKSLDNLSLKLVDVRTTGMDERLGKSVCAANLVFTAPAGSTKVPIQYTSELANGGKQFFVTVYGL